MSRTSGWYWRRGWSKIHWVNSGWGQTHCGHVVRDVFPAETPKRGDHCGTCIQSYWHTVPERLRVRRFIARAEVAGPAGGGE